MCRGIGLVFGVGNEKKFKNHIDMTVTNEGLRIELTESEKGTFFDSGKPKISSDGEELLKALAAELAKLPNTIAMEGHTDSKRYTATRNYGNWELSSDRANAARRLMQEAGIRANQVTQVRGFADQRLRKKDDPLDASNRRISLIVQYLDRAADERLLVKPASRRLQENRRRTCEDGREARIGRKNSSPSCPEEEVVVVA